MTEAIRISGISKSFSGNLVLDNISLSFNSGEIHAICGENGAGKSTLMKIIGGVYTADSGRIWVRGEEVQIRSPQDAFRHGIGIVHQELSLCENMPVWHNVFVNREHAGPLGMIKKREMQEETKTVLGKLNMHIDPRARVSTLPFATRQMIEIAKILSMNIDVLIFDEPTSALSERETQALFELLLTLRNEGKAIVFISHKLDEVLSISDRITVLRDGCLVGTLDTKEATSGKIVSMMVGRDIKDLYPPKAKNRNGKTILQVSGVSRKAKFADISFELKAGEILGLYGLVGSGRTELALSLVGADRLDSGTMLLEGSPFAPRSPRQAIKKGVCYLSEDRKQLGLFLEMSVADNIVAAALDSVTSPLGTVLRQEVQNVAEELIEELDVIPKKSDLDVGRLSGGNQQKVLMGKWLAARPKVLIVDEPSRGVDVGAKSRIHFLLRDLANQGMAVMMISSDLPEILGLSDRIMVMHEGKLQGILENEGLTQEKIMSVAYGEEVVSA